MLLEQKKRMQDNLPHLYGYPWYGWAENFFNSRNRLNFLCAANQISKSSTQIRKMIHWATCPKLWPKLWPDSCPPRQFWYMYPNADVATSEFKTKWEPEFLPRNEMKDASPQYGWKSEFERGLIKAIHFDSGVTCYFKSYMQQSINLQTSTVWAVFADEEMPVHIYDEIAARLRSTRGHFHMVFTATLGQEFWWRVIEGEGENELLPDAHKQQISMYDCQVYSNGEKTKWTPERIKEEEGMCKSQAEIERRIKGRFVKDSGLKYASFEPHRHYIKPRTINEDWRIYAGIDLGAGGKNHPSAISIVAVSPDCRKGEVIDGWRGDSQVTTAGDLLEKYMDFARKYRIVRACYDPRAHDLGVMASRAGVSLEKADNRHETGEQTINTLFKNDMLHLHDTIELRKLGAELASVPLGDLVAKKRLKDDFCDSLRYCVTAVPWDWEAVREKVHGVVSIRPDGELTEEELEAWKIAKRRGEAPARGGNDWDEFYNEIDEWNEYYG